MNNYDISIIAGKYRSAVFELASSTGTQADAICNLLNQQHSFTEFMEYGHCIKYAPESCIEEFKILKKELKYIEKKLEKERDKKILKFPDMKNDIIKSTTIKSVIAKLHKGSHTQNIINSICNIAFELERLKTMNKNDIKFISLKDFKTVLETI